MGLKRKGSAWLAFFVVLGSAGWLLVHGAPGWTIVGWNDLGMHCMDSDYSVFSILPPYNNIHAHVIDPTGHTVTDPAASGVSVTYEAVADPQGSINTGSSTKPGSGPTSWTCSG